jgi:hypothetical protein
MVGFMLVIYPEGLVMEMCTMANKGSLVQIGMFPLVW